MQEYEEYYQMKFNRQPKFARKKGGSSTDSNDSTPSSSASTTPKKKAYVTWGI